MDILLVQIRDQKTNIGIAEMPPLGLMYLNTNLQANGFSSRIIDFNLYNKGVNNDLQILVDSVKRDNPKMIGFSSFTQNYYEYKYLCINIKRIFPDIVLFYGGCHASFTVSETMHETPVDLIIKQEGEETVVELAQYYINGRGDISNIKGIGYRNENGIVETRSREMIKDLDAIPIPDRTSIAIEKYNIPGTILASRGCVGKCLFCSAEAMSGGCYRVRTAANVCDEIRYLYEKFGIREMSFIDNTFTVYEKRTQEICKELELLGISWDCESRVDFINENLIKIMKKSGCTGIQYGIESGDDRVLKDIRKALNVKQIRKLVQTTVDCGIQTVFCGFIVGHPTDTIESIRNTFELAKEMLRIGAKVGVKISTPFPGTQLAKVVEKEGFRVLTKKWSMYTLMQPIYENPFISAKELYKLYISQAEELAKLTQKYKEES